MSGPPRLRLTFSATLAATAEAQARLADYLRAQGAPDRLVARVELVFEEVAVNIVRHAFGPDAAPDAVPCAREASLEAAPEPEGCCTLVIEDAGRPFDPTSAPLVTPARSLEDSAIGGLGLPLIRRTAREMAYARLPEGRNRLTLVIPAA